MIFWNPLCSNL